MTVMEVKGSLLLLKETAHHAVLKLYSGNNDSNADYTKMFKKMVVKVDIKEKPVFNGDEISSVELLTITNPLEYSRDWTELSLRFILAAIGLPIFVVIS